MTTSQASRIYCIPYNSLLMYVRGKYGKSLRLDVLKKNTPAANDNLNTIGNSRSTPKEKNIKREEAKEKIRKASQDSAGIGAVPPPVFPMFPFEPPGMGPFNPALLPFSPLAEQINMLGLPNAEYRIRDLMAGVQTLQNQSMRAGAENLRALADRYNANDPPTPGQDGNLRMGLASLLIKAKEIQDQSGEGEGDDIAAPPNTKSEECSGGGSVVAEDMDTDTDSIPQARVENCLIKVP